VVRTIENYIAVIDKILTEQVNEILHHPDFQKLEGTWRGLHYLANNTETEANVLEIRVLNVSKEEIGRSLERYQGVKWDTSPIFKKIYNTEYGVFGGHPYGCLIGDYYFDYSNEDVQLLRNLAQVCAAAHVPFVAGAAPSLFKMGSWLELANPPDLKRLMTGPEYAAWNALRESEDSRYLGLTMPRVLAREPWGPTTKKVEGFAFEEEAGGHDHSKYCWMNAAYAMGANINRAFKLYGWCSRIRGPESGGLVTNLPLHTFPTDEGDLAMKCPTEIAITYRRDKELSDLGLIGLVHEKNKNQAAFFSAQSIQKPKEYQGPEGVEATANARLSANLPYLFAACRFAHYLNKIVNDKIGSFKEREDMERWLQTWINNYVLSGVINPPDELRAKKPLAAAKVEVDAIEANPGYYRARFYLRPHFQLEGLTASIRLVSRVPSGKK
jgi:type VI secretion system protein ImpC